MTALDEAVFQVKAMIENKLDSLKVSQEKLEKLTYLKKLKIKRLKGGKLTAEEINKGMELLCWKNFAGCCAPEKECPWHRAVCDALGVTPEQVYEAKNEAVNQLLGIKDEKE